MKRKFSRCIDARSHSRHSNSVRGSQQTVNRQISVTMTDFAFTPNSFTVPAGEEITFQATNNGAVNHSFAIMQPGP